MHKAFGYILKIIALIFWASALLGVAGVVENFEHFSKSSMSMLGAAIGFFFYVLIGYGFMRWSYKYEE
jgi:hypothetical protein